MFIMTNIPADTERTAVRDRMDGLLAAFENGDFSGLPVSFLYGAKPSAEWLSAAAYRVGGDFRKDACREVICIWDDGCLRFSVAFRVYHAYPAVEWLPRFENIGDAGTDRIHQIKSLSVRMESGAAYTVYTGKGDRAQPDDYGLRVRPVADGETITLTSGAANMSSHDDLAFFAAENAEGRGISVAVGWSGSWNAGFRARSDGLDAEVAHTAADFHLAPGESVRSHRILVTEWQGGQLRGRNITVRLLAGEYLPKDETGKTRLPMVTVNAAFTGNGQGYRLRISEAEILSMIEAQQKAGLKAFIVDAGWWECDKWEENHGDYTLSPTLFPDNLKEVAGIIRKYDGKFGLWFPVERMFGTVPFARENPNLVDSENGGIRLRLELPGAREHILDAVRRLRADYGMKIYRQDLDAYINEQPGRAGVNEMRHFEGLYRLQEDMQSVFPDMILEGCCSGGGRIDLESLTHFSWFQKSDYNWFTKEKDQMAIYGASHFIPGGYLNIPVMHYDDYSVWSAFGGQMVVGWSDADDEWDEAVVTRHLDLYRQAAPYLHGDFYPLTAGVDGEGWLAYQFADPEGRGGFAQFFRRSEAAEDGPAARTFSLNGVRDEAVYRVLFASRGAYARMTGRELKNVEVACQRVMSAELILYAAD